MSAFGSLADIALYKSKVRLPLAGFAAVRGNDEFVLPDLGANRAPDDDHGHDEDGGH